MLYATAIAAFVLGAVILIAVEDRRQLGIAQLVGGVLAWAGFVGFLALLLAR